MKPEAFAKKYFKTPKNYEKVWQCTTDPKAYIPALFNEIFDYYKVTTREKIEKIAQLFKEDALGVAKEHFPGPLYSHMSCYKNGQAQLHSNIHNIELKEIVLYGASKHHHAAVLKNLKLYDNDYSYIGYSEELKPEDLADLLARIKREGLKEIKFKFINADLVGKVYKKNPQLITENIKLFEIRSFLSLLHLFSDEVLLAIHRDIDYNHDAPNYNKVKSLVAYRGLESINPSESLQSHGKEYLEGVFLKESVELGMTRKVELIIKSSNDLVKHKLLYVLADDAFARHVNGNRTFWLEKTYTSKEYTKLKSDCIEHIHPLHIKKEDKSRYLKKITSTITEERKVHGFKFAGKIQPDNVSWIAEHYDAIFSKISSYKPFFKEELEACKKSFSAFKYYYLKTKNSSKDKRQTLDTESHLKTLKRILEIRS